MPQATPARNTARDRLKTRPSVAARGVSAEHAPVLFRLPIIMAAPAMEHVGPLDSVQSPPAPPPIIARSAVASSASVGAAAMVSFPAVNVVGPPSANSPQSNNSQSSAAQLATAAVPAASRSWWEHWSSGVVLILLIIALVTASILALNDSGKSKVDQLAGEPATAAADEFDLSNITIPDIAASKPAVGGDTASRAPLAESTASNIESDATKTQSPATSIESATTKTQSPATIIREGALELSSVPTTASTYSSTVSSTPTTPAPTTPAPTTAPTSTASSSTANANPLNLNTATSGAATSGTATSGTAVQPPQATLALPAAANLVTNPQSSTPGRTATPTQSAAPLASLALPVGVVLPPLFNAHAQSDLGGSVPSFTASGPTATPTNSGGHGAVQAAQPAAGAPGASPTFYDGAALGPELHAAMAGRDTNAVPVNMGAAAPQTAMSNSAVASGGLVDTNLPSFETILASATRPVAGSSGGAPGQPAVGMIDRYGRSAVVSTATPDLNSQALTNASLPYIQTNKASNGAASNRFAPAAQTPAPPAAGRGFMLGNP